jgi:hypothetical protein
MNLLNIVKGVLNLQKPIDLKTLPSQGIFYKDDFKMSIKRADMEDIIEYEHNYIVDNLGLVINKLKRVVEKNTFFSEGYGFNDIKSIDVVFIFLEIVKFTTAKPIKLNFFDDELGIESQINFEQNYFNYFRIDDHLMSNFDTITKEFLIDGFRYSIPTIGAENCLTKFLISKSGKPGAERYNKFSYDFTYFIGGKNYLNFEEIENLIQIFNFDMEQSERIKVKNIVRIFSPLQKYSLIKDNRIIDINSKINLQDIFK